MVQSVREDYSFKSFLAAGNISPDWRLMVV
jgi:hypothetical protein